MRPTVGLFLWWRSRIFVYRKSSSSTRCATSTFRTGSRSKSGSGRTHGAFVEQRSQEVGQCKHGSSRSLTTVGENPSLESEQATSPYSFMSSERPQHHENLKSCRPRYPYQQAMTS